MPEHLPQNEHDLNQAALAQLHRAKARPQSDLLYALQLMHWGLNEGGLSLEPRFELIVRDRLDELMGLAPTAAWAYLKLWQNGPDPSEIRNAPTPKSAATTLIEAFAKRLLQVSPSLRLSD